MTTLSRRTLLSLAGFGAGAVALSGCSQVTGKGEGSDGAGSSHILTIGAALGGEDQTANQFPENFNANGGGDAAPGLGLFYETLFRVSQKDGGKLQPNLAEKVEYSDGGRVATYTLRKDVTWNDGTPFTADDVVFTYNFVFGPPGPLKKKNPASSNFLAEKVKKTDDHTVVVHYNMPQYQEDTNLSEYYPIYPKHIYDKVGDHSKYVDKNPVGTGPGKLKSFNGTRIEIDIRDDYWGGKAKGVTSVVIVPQGTVGNIQSQISHAKVDWADGGGQGVLTHFLHKSEDNRYNFWPDGSNTGLQFGCRHKPMGDKYVRLALRGAIDFQAIQKAVGTGYPIPSITGLDPQLYGDLIIEGYRKPATQDVKAAKQALADGGYTVKGGKLTKGGKTYPLELMINLGQAVHVQVGPMLIDMWKSVLGLEVKQVSRADQVFQKEIHDHTMAIWNVNLNGSAYNAYQAYSHVNLGEKQQKAGYGNQGMWRCPDAVNQALLDLQATPPTDTAAIKKSLAVIEQAFVDEAPVVPLIPGGNGEMYTVKNWTGWPEPGTSDYPPRTSGYNNICKTVVNLTTASD